MINLEPCIRGFKSNGYAKVYIRATKYNEVQYISTPFAVNQRQVTKNKITDFAIIAEIAPFIKKYYDKLNMMSSQMNLPLKAIILLLNKESQEVSFTDFYQKYTNNMIANDRANSASNYTCALNSLLSFIQKTSINFSDITSNTINSWITSLSNTARAKNAYPVCISTVFKAGLLEYNDYDLGIIRIKHQPFMRVKIPKPTKGKKKAVTADVLHQIFTADTSTIYSLARAEMAQDVAILSFCLAAINTADLYFMEKNKLVGNKLCYNRHKTESEREDNAYTEITIPETILPLIKKYQGKKRLFKFFEIYKDNDYFNTGINKGLKQICKSLGIDNITTYTLRHSWATIAQNHCGASTEVVGFALNHASAHKVTEGYITKDYSPIDELNNKVIQFVKI